MVARGAGGRLVTAWLRGFGARVHRPGLARLARLVGLASMVGLAACSETPAQLNLVVYDPCNQQALAQTDQLELQIRDSSGALITQAVWDTAARRGSLEDVPYAADATVSLLGWRGVADPQLGTLVARATLGGVDLGGEGGSGAGGDGGPRLLAFDLVLGQVGHFKRTTDTVSKVGQCSNGSVERYGHTATLLKDGRVLVVGGEGLAGVGAGSGVSGGGDGDGVGDSGSGAGLGAQSEIWHTTEFFHETTGVFAQGPDLRWARRGHTSTLLADGRVLVAGGEGRAFGGGSGGSGGGAGGLGAADAVTVWNVARVFDPVSGSWSAPIAMMGQRAFHSATLLGDGTVLLAGGQLDGAALATSEVFDPRSNRFRPGPQLAVARSHHGALWLAGGGSAGAGGSAGEGGFGGSGGSGTGDAGATGAGTVLLVGGRSGTNVLDAVSFVDPVAGRVVAGPALTVGRSDVVLQRLPESGLVVVAGGYTRAPTALEPGVGSDAVDVMVVDPAMVERSVWQPCSHVRLAAGRGAGASAVLQDGTILLAGGMDTSGAPAVMGERLQPVFGQLCSVGSVPTEGLPAMRRAGLVATVLRSGDVLFTGGYRWIGGKRVGVSESEVYVPGF